MKVYNRKLKRNVERQVHFGVGNSVKTACGLTLFSRRIMVSIIDFPDHDGAIITDNLSRVTCKRCLAVREGRLRKMIEVQESAPGVFDRPSLCGEDWLLEHGLSVKLETIDSQKLEVTAGQSSLTLSKSDKGRKKIMRAFVKEVEGKGR